MNIVQLLKNKESSVTLIYYGKNDMASGFQIKTLIDNYEDIESYYKNKEFKVNSIDDYIDYIFIDTYSQLKELIPIVRENIKENISRIVDILINIKEHYKIGNINKYIIMYYLKILSEKELKKYELHAYEIIEYTLNYIKCNYKYFKEHFEIYQYIVKNYAYRIFLDFKDYENIFFKYPKLEELLFSNQIIKEQMATKVYDLEDALKFIKRHNKELYNKSIEDIYSMVKKRSFVTNDEKIMYTYDDLKSTARLFKILGENRRYDEFNEKVKKQKKKLDNYITKNGHHSKFEINIKEFAKLFEDKNTTWEIKSLAITHTRKNKKIYSRIQSAVERKIQPTLVDYVAHVDVDVNDYFTFSVQNNLSMTILVGKLMLNYMLVDENRLKELINYMFAGVANYLEKNDIKIPNIDDDFNMLSFVLKNLILEFQKKERDNLICEYWSYNVLHLTIGILEKILRELCYRFMKINKYIPYNKMTLEQILSSEETEKFFGQANIRTFRYYLTSYDYVGKNLRNDICHYNNNIKEICTYDNVLLVLYLLLTLCNELLLKVIQKIVS